MVAKKKPTVEENNHENSKRPKRGSENLVESNIKSKNSKNGSNSNDSKEAIAVIANNSNNNNNRKLRFQEVAERRAAHFARADDGDSRNNSKNVSSSGKIPSSVRSSTPTGSMRAKSAADSKEPEVWPGPFATANNIMQRRDELKKLREERILQRDQGEAQRLVDEDSLDKYELAVLRLDCWNPCKDTKDKDEYNNYYSFSSIPSLTDKCIDVLVQFIDHVVSLDCLSVEARDRVAIALAKKRKLNNETVGKLCCENSQSLSIPECSSIDEDSLTQALTVTKGDQSVTVLQLSNCGRSLTDRMAISLVDFCPSLEVLRLTGCYKLSDNTLSLLLSRSCASSLRSLDLSFDSRLSGQALSVIRDLSMLESLSLQDCTQLGDADLRHLLPEYRQGSSQVSRMRRLTSLSLSGLIDISDQVFEELITEYGSILQSINISGCVNLTDASIVAIRSNCSSLRKIDVSNLTAVSTSAWIGLFVASPTTPTDDNNNDNNNIMQIPFSIGKLEMVNLQGNVSVTDEVVVCLTELSQQSLEHLDLNGCYNITTRAGMAIKMNCQEKLKHLDISFVRGVSEDCVGVLVDTCYALNNIHVWGI